MSSEVQTLTEMGFDKDRAERAIKETGNMGIEAAMEWLLSHPEEQAPVESKGQEVAEGATTSAEDEGAKSLKCEDCGKLFPGVHEAEYHATKSGHSNFSESTDSVKPLTEEEKQAQLLKVQEMLRQRRKEREEKEKQEQLEREKSRRVLGKELSQARQKFEEQEMKKALDQRKREKEEEKMARQRVKEQIERDRLDREAKFAQTCSVPTPSQQQQPQQQQQQQKTCSSTLKECNDTRLQIRLLDGSKLMESFSAKETLAAVRVFVQQKSSQYSDMVFTFATTFPRKEFTEDEMQTPLTLLGLVPSAVLMVKKL